MTHLFPPIPKAMDVKEAERVVVAKPVASRPACSGFRSFSELLAGAINAAPPTVRPENPVPAIRPKTVRFKPTVNRPQSGPNSSQGDMACTDNHHSSDQALQEDRKPFVVYRPLAKFVSKATVSLLANMGNFSADDKQASAVAPAKVEAHLQHQDQNEHIIKSQTNSNYQPSIQFHTEAHQSAETSKISSQFVEEDAKSTLPPSCDRPSYDGYNWRKYGQKQVKGSEYPRSYYKCTHPNCPVKKKVERSLDGQIAEIVYKGEHSHSKPQPPKRSNSSGTQGAGLVPEGAGHTTDDQPYSHSTNEGGRGRVENQSEAQLPALFYQHSYDPIASQGGVPAGSCGMSGECEDGSKGTDIDENESRSKRRKVEKQSSEASLLGCESSQEPRILVQNTTDTEMVGDGFRWRKYGQKVVKGNPYPRSYYRCTSLKCNVRKHVERASDDPSAFITTYEGKHNHEMPLRNKNAATSESSKDRN